MNNEEMTTKVFCKRLWLHKDPEVSGNFNEIFRSRTEPFLDKDENAAALSLEAHLDGDMFVHVPTVAKPLLPKQLWEWIDWGDKVELEVSVTARKKKLEDPITDMISKAVEENKKDGEEYLKTHDRMLFVLRNESVIHERQFVLHTPFSDGSGRKNVEYINSYGAIIRHPECDNPQECYDVLGYVGDVVSPLQIGRIWGNDSLPTCNFKETLTKAYQHGLRFLDAPDEDEIVFNVETVAKDIVSISCISDFYGFGENMLFCSLKDYQENAKLGVCSLDKKIINVIVAYRWFFNKPNLHATLKTTSGKNIDQNEMDTLCELITDKVNEKYAKYIKSGKSKNSRPYFDPRYLRTKSFLIPYAEEAC